MDSPCTVSRAREVVAEEYGHTPGEKGATSSSPVVDAGEVATSAVEDVAVAQDNGDGGDEDDAEKLLREAIAARKPNAAKRLDEPEAERITTGTHREDTGAVRLDSGRDCGAAGRPWVLRVLFRASGADRYRARALSAARQAGEVR